MMPALMPFLFDGAALIRVVDRAGAPWFVAKDVAEALGYADPAKAVSTHCKRAVAIGEGEGVSPPPGGRFEKKLSGADCPTKDASPTPGGRFAHPLLDPQTKLIPEGDVFRLILRSRLPAAARFETWVMEELLPAVRKGVAFHHPVPIEPNRETDALNSILLRAVSECRKVFGERAAGQLWFKLGLPMVGAMTTDSRQGDLMLPGG